VVIGKRSVRLLVYEGVEMKRLPFLELQRYNPNRKVTWRWDRAHDLVNTGRYYSTKRDGQAVGIAVAYLRDMARCLSELRLRRVVARYEHVDRAKKLWEAFDGCRLELETRILARQNDVEIAYELSLPAETIQAYRDLFFHVDDRIDASNYILFNVIGMHPWLPSNPVVLMQSSVYFHGAAIVEPWLRYLQKEQNASNLNSEIGRLMARIDLFVAAHSIPVDTKTSLSLLRLAPILFKNGSNLSKSVSMARAFSESTAKIASKLDLASSALPPFSYAPVGPTRLTKRFGSGRQQNRRAA
jgi:hypothetical protein